MKNTLSLPKPSHRWLTAAIALVAAMGSATAAYGQVSTPIADAVQSSGLSGGNRASACGNLSASPNQTLQVTEAFASVNISLQGEGQLTLLIEGPGGFSECRTTAGSEGQINAPGLLNQGVYSIYVGNEANAQTPYTLSIRQN
jgi:hypothetical protein